MDRLIAVILILTPLITHPMESASLEEQLQEAEDLQIPDQNNLYTRLHEVGIRSAEFSAAGSKIVTCSSDKTATIWYTETGRFIHTIRGLTGHVHPAKFSPAGDKIVTCCEDKTARIWDTETGKLLHVLGQPVGTSFLYRLITHKLNNGHTDDVISAIFSPTGNRIATCSRDGTAKLWDTETGKLIHTLKQPFGQPALTIAFNLTGDTVAVGCIDNATIWNTETGNCFKYALSGYCVSHIAFNPAGNQVLTTSLGTDAFTPGATALLWHIPPSDQIVTESVDNELDIEKMKPLHKLPGYPNINSAIFNREGNKVLVRSWSTVRLWDTATGNLIHEFKDYASPIISAMFDSTNNKILICSSGNGGLNSIKDSDTTLQIADTETGRILDYIVGITSTLSVAQFAPNDDKVLTISAFGKVTLVKWWVNLEKVKS